MAGGGDRRADAQAQYLVRAARLVSEVSHRRPQARHSAPAQGPHPFGGDYPLFSYERLVKDWRAEGYPPEILDKVFYKNAERFLADAGFKGRI